jgi:glycosyltransferase involved in cell wall biosynthesis
VARRVLLIDFAPSPGGSIISLYYLVKGLRGSPFAPQLLLASSNPYVPRFRELGLEVSTLDARQGLGDLYRPSVQRARESAVSDWVRRTKPAAAVWHFGGFWLRFWRRILPQARQVRDLARRHQVDLIHCNDAISISRVGVLGARLARLPCVCHTRRFEHLGWFEKELARSVNSFIFISEAIQQRFMQQTRQGPNQRVVYNGLDLVDFPLHLDGQAVRAALGLRPDAPVIGMIGRLVEWKGHSVFLRALARVADEIPSVQGLIVGGPEASSPHLPGQLRELASSLDLDESVRFTGHRVDVAPMLAAVDLLAHTSVEPEPFGRVVIEGMAMARPVIASDCGGVPELVRDGETGLLVAPGDVQGVASAILSLLRDPRRAQAMGLAGRQRVETHFTAARHVQQVQRVYREVLGVG